MRTRDEWQALIEQCGVHPVLGPEGDGYWIEQTPEELASFLVQLPPIATVLEVGTGFKAGLARFMDEFLVWKVTSIDIRNYGHAYAGIDFQVIEWPRVEVAIFQEPFDLVIIDGDHAYEAVKEDYDHYNQYGKKVVAFHDIAGLRDCQGVEKFWREIAYTKTGKLRKGYFEAIAEHDKRSGLGWIAK